MLSLQVDECDVDLSSVDYAGVYSEASSESTEERTLGVMMDETPSDRRRRGSEALAGVNGADHAVEGLLAAPGSFLILG
jgi:hypothetical protein